MATATWNGTVVARADDTVVVEGHHYFALDEVVVDLLEASERTSVCPWQGSATYFDVVVDGERNRDAAWTYPAPEEAAAAIAGRVAFWRGVVVTPE